MMLFFWVLLVVGNPLVFTNPYAYTSVMTSTLPTILLLATALIFTTTSGVLDLSYASTIGIGAWAFAYLAASGYSPWLGVGLAVILGISVGLLNSVLVLYFRLTPLIATLGMLFLVRGFVNILSNGKSIPLAFIQDTGFYQVCCGKIGIFPLQMLWALLFALITWVIYSHHRFGKHIHIIGDNEESAREMGIPINRVKTFPYVYTGIASALAGVFIATILNTFWPNTGEAYMLPTLSAIFVGGNPLVGGMGTVVGAIIGSFTTSFIETGIIAAGFDEFYTRFVHGVVLIVSLLGFRTARR
jgi:simple sugar transport system permease protein